MKRNLEVFTIDQDLPTKEQFFHMERTMFYLDHNDCVVYPTEEHRDKSHYDWFKDAGVSGFEFKPRGYIFEGRVHIYIGENFEVPDFSIKRLCNIMDSLKVCEIKLGAIKGEIGTDWQPICVITRY